MVGELSNLVKHTDDHQTHFKRTKLIVKNNEREYCYRIILYDTRQAKITRIIVNRRRKINEKRNPNNGGTKT